MKTMTIMTGLLTAWFLVASCSQQEFAGDSGSAGTYKKGKPGKGNNTNNKNPNGDSTNTNGSSLNPDDGGKVQLIDAELTISKSEDSAAFKNCLFASIEGQPQVELGCNRVSPRGDRIAQKTTTMKLKTNECNVLKLALHTQRDGELTPTLNVNTTTSIKRFQIQRLEPGKFKINANDNNDDNWKDLNVTIYTTNPKIKFTIENSGIVCD